ncbi:MAG: DUF1232 domain-containing protein [Deltaproteobacteria bacterium]|nr:DUF1232 domain-containing protein [Deltaproteobacteria bacterium]
MPDSPAHPKRVRSAKSPAQLLPAIEVEAYLLEQAARIAPADVDSLLARAREVRDKAAGDGKRHARFHRQLEVALQLLRDHAKRVCPQIPYHTVSLLAAALYYWLEPIDAIPDFIAGAGTCDDALVLELACALGAAGLERYCTFKGIATDAVLTVATRG